MDLPPEQFADPLVPPPGSGLDLWVRRCVALLRQTGGPLARLLLLTVAAPQFAWSMLVDSMTGGMVYGQAAGTGFGDLPAGFTGASAVTLLVATLVSAGCGALGWAAGVWAVTQSAAGLPVTVADALRAGSRRLVPMAGWYVAYGGLILVGLLLCIVPGLYLAAAAALFSFPVVYERGRNPFARSFALVHEPSGAAFGRVALLLVLFIGGSFLLVGVTGALGLGSAESTAGRAAAALVDALALVPFGMVLLVGLLLTYTQARARVEPVTTAGLWRAANPPAAEAPEAPAGQ